MDWMLQTLDNYGADPDFCYLERDWDEAMPDDLYMVTDGYDPAGLELVMPGLHMHRKFGGKLLPDVCFNTTGLWVVSSAFADWVIQRAGVPASLHPITVFDHRRKPVAKQRLVLNPCGWVDCIDRERTRGSRQEVPWSPRTAADGPVLERDWSQKVYLHHEYAYIDSFAVVPELVPVGVNIFRPKSFPGLLIWRAELAAEAREAGFTGLDFRAEDEDLDMLTI